MFDSQEIVRALLILALAFGWCLASMHRNKA